MSRFSIECLPGEIMQAQNDNHDHARKNLQARERAVRAVDKTIRAADAVIRAAQDMILSVEQEVPDPRQRDLFAYVPARPAMPPLRRPPRRLAGRLMLTGSLVGALSLPLMPDLPPAWTNHAGSAIASATSLVARLIAPKEAPTSPDPPAKVAPVADPPVAKLEALPIRLATEAPPDIAEAGAEVAPPAPRAVATISTSAPEPEQPAPPSPPIVDVVRPAAKNAAACSERADTAVLVRRGEDFVAAGDIASARLLFRRAALACDARAALALAATFDPNMLRRLGVHGVAPDQESARTWYLKASALGSAEASHRLAALGTRGD